MQSAISEIEERVSVPHRAYSTASQFNRQPQPVSTRANKTNDKIKEHAEETIKAQMKGNQVNATK